MDLKNNKTEETEFRETEEWTKKMHGGGL